MAAEKLEQRLARTSGMFFCEYAAKNKVSHPKSVYLPEQQLLPRPDEWLTRKFDPVALPSTMQDLEAARPDTAKPDETARREIAECDAKVRQHRAALEAVPTPFLSQAG